MDRMIAGKIMRTQFLVVFLLMFFLAGCGSISVGVDYGSTQPLGSDSTPAAASRQTVQENTPAQPVERTSTPTAELSATSTITPESPRVVGAALGKTHSCAVLENGRVKCWGTNEYRQLGNETMLNSLLPVEVEGLVDAKALAAGWGHTCALTRTGGVKCWGYNKNGELGNGQTVDSGSPVAVQGLSAGVIAIEAGDDHTCAVTGQGAVKCWGYNQYGQLGDGTTTSRSVPVSVSGLVGGALSVAAGWGHTCALTVDKSVKCWGNDEYGQLGYGQTEDYRFTPIDVAGLAMSAERISADGGQTCALTIYGGIRCWGNNTYGQLGDGTAETRNSPVAVSGLAQGMRNVTAGWNHTCAISKDGGLLCWGWNYYGQLGDGTKASRTTPVEVYGLSQGIVTLSVGWRHTCAVTDLGAMNCWGANNAGQLGDGTSLDSQVPQAVAGLTGGLRPTSTRAVSTATSPPTATFSPWSMLFLSDLSAGKDFTCAVSEGSRVYCWGAGESGQLGNGSNSDSAVPVEVSGLGDISIDKIESGQSHACLLTDQGKMLCWGANEHGQLGDATTMDSPVPVKVSVISEEVFQMALGEDFTCVMIYKGVKCWGGNAYGQLGNGTMIDSILPVEPKGPFENIRNISAGKYSACLEDAWGKVFCWGDNSYGQLGNGTTLAGSTPAAVKGLGDVYDVLSVGINHTCAGARSRDLQCWGANSAGQLGDGTTADRRTAVYVRLLEGVEIMEAGDAITCIMTVSYTMACWGDHHSGVLGRPLCSSLGSFCSEPVYFWNPPIPPAFFSLGNAHVCMLSIYGDLFCWGSNTHGQLGDGTKVNRESPVRVLGIGETAGPTTKPPDSPLRMTNTPTPTYGP
jgi:alpha-tubulin suppressor-like RCC1 family protein